MKKLKPRIPEGGAIDNSSEMSMKEYSEMMKKMFAERYDLFAYNVIEIYNLDTVHFSTKL